MTLKCIGWAQKTRVGRVTGNITINQYSYILVLSNAISGLPKALIPTVRWKNPGEPIDHY